MLKHSEYKEQHDESPCAHHPTSTIKSNHSTPLNAGGAPSDCKGEEKALTSTIPFGTSGPNSFFGPNICSHPSPSPSVTREERDLGETEEESSTK